MFFLDRMNRMDGINRMTEGPQRGAKSTKKRICFFVRFVPFCGYSGF